MLFGFRIRRNLLVFELFGWLLIISVFLLSITTSVIAQNSDATKELGSVSLDDTIGLEVNNATLAQVLDAISDKTGVEIIWRGEIPSKIVDYSLTAKSIFGLLEKTMLLFDVGSFVTTQREESGKLISIEVIGFEGGSSASFRRSVPPEAKLEREAHDGKLSETQRRALLERSVEFDSSEFGAVEAQLTDAEKETIKELEEARSESELAGSGQLDKKQLELVKERSFWIEREEQEDAALTPAQLMQLRIDSQRIERELEESSKPLSEGQLRMLREKEI